MVNAEFGWKLLLFLSRARQQPATMKIQSDDKRTERKTRTVGWKSSFQEKAVVQLFKQSIFRRTSIRRARASLVLFLLRLSLHMLRDERQRQKTLMDCLDDSGKFCVGKLIGNCCGTFLPTLFAGTRKSGSRGRN